LRLRISRSPGGTASRTWRRSAEDDGGRGKGWLFSDHFGTSGRDAEAVADSAVIVGVRETWSVSVRLRRFIVLDVKCNLHAIRRPPAGAVSLVERQRICQLQKCVKSAASRADRRGGHCQSAHEARSMGRALLSCPAGWPVSTGQPSKVVVADRGARSCRNCVRFLSAGLLGLGLSSALTWGTAPSKFAPEMRLGPLPSASARYVVRRKNPALLPIRLSSPISMPTPCT
jgi:hypothetical protein